MRDRLIELIKKMPWRIEQDWRGCRISNADECADYLLANGVIVPPYRNETTIYFVESSISCVWEGRISSWSVQKDGLWFYAIYTCGLNYWHKEHDIGKTVFLTREEAERALKERE